MGLLPDRRGSRLNSTLQPALGQQSWAGKGGRAQPEKLFSAFKIKGGRRSPREKTQTERARESESTCMFVWRGSSSLSSTKSTSRQTTPQ